MTLKKGNYMVAKEVVDYVECTTGKKANIKLPIQVMYYNTEDLKSIMPAKMFRDMECVVATLMVTK